MSLSPLIGLIAASIFTPSGIQYVGGYVVDVSTLAFTTDYTISLSGNLSGGIANSPQAGDFCIISYATANTADRSNRSIYNAASAFTQLMTAYVNDTNDTNITIAYKFLESPIDYNVTVGVSSAASGASGMVATIEVFRNVNTTTPFDVAYTSNPLINSGLPNPLSITPTTAGSKIVVFGAGAYVLGVTHTFTSSDFDIFTSLGVPGTSRSVCTAFGYKDWTSGAFDAAAFGGPGASLADSCIAVALALRPQ